MDHNLPNTVEDEEELDEYATKGQKATNEGERYKAIQPTMVGDLPGNLIGAHWVIHRLHTCT